MFFLCLSKHQSIVKIANQQMSFRILDPKFRDPNHIIGHFRVSSSWQAKNSRAALEGIQQQLSMQLVGVLYYPLYLLLKTLI